MKTIDLYFYELARVNVVDLCVNMSKGKRREAKLAKKAAKAEKVLEKQNEVLSKKGAAVIPNTQWKIRTPKIRAVRH